MGPAKNIVNTTNPSEGRHCVNAALKTALLQTHFKQDRCWQQDAPVVIAP